MTERNNGKLEPARSVLAAFSTPKKSGVAIVAAYLGLDKSSVQRWMMPKELHGLGGNVPGRHFVKLRRLARKQGVKLPWELLTGEAFRE